MRVITSWWSALTRSAGRFGVLNLVIAALLSTVVMLVAAGVLDTSTPSGLAARIGELTMVVPVAWRRPWPVAAAATLLVATVLNGLIFGSLARCNVALPAIFLVAFAVADRCDRRRAGAGLLLCLAATVAEGMSDPRIELSGLTLTVPLAIAFFVAGRILRARSEAASRLRATSAELRRQRERTAQLAVLADRAQLSADLDHTLRAQLGGIAAAAASGLQQLDEAPAEQGAARLVMAQIERDGRAVLGQMRDLVGSLHEPLLTDPQPTLARLPELLATAATASAKLTVEGNPRTLPAGLELSGYRIVEHLLQALDDGPDRAIDVRLRFCPDAIELQVRGARSKEADLASVLAAAAERAHLHGGTVRHRLQGATCYATAWLPLVSGHA